MENTFYANNILRVSSRGHGQESINKTILRCSKPKYFLYKTPLANQVVGFTAEMDKKGRFLILNIDMELYKDLYEKIQRHSTIEIIKSSSGILPKGEMYLVTDIVQDQGIQISFDKRKITSITNKINGYFRFRQA